MTKIAPGEGGGKELLAEELSSGRRVFVRNSLVGFNVVLYAPLLMLVN